MEVVASLSQGRTAAAQCGLFTYKSVPVIFEPPCISREFYNLIASAKGRQQRPSKPRRKCKLNVFLACVLCPIQKWPTTVCCVYLLQLFRTVRSIPRKAATRTTYKHAPNATRMIRTACLLTRVSAVFRIFLVSCNLFIFVNLFIRQKCTRHITGFYTIHTLLHGHIHRSSVSLFL